MFTEIITQSGKELHTHNGYLNLCLCYEY